MQRLTWSGIALHAGQLPGYPASKGCIRLPYDFSERLFGVTKMGGLVVIANEKSPNARFTSNPGLVLGAHNQSPEMLQPLASLDYRWMPEKSPDGPVTILISGADRELYAYRSGILIGRGSFALRDRSNRSLGEHVFTLLASPVAGGNPWQVKGGSKPWMQIDPDSDNTGMTPQKLGAQLILAPGLADRLYGLAAPGTTVVVTDEPALGNSSLNIVTTD
jgi:hypothetical protein